MIYILKYIYINCPPVPLLQVEAEVPEAALSLVTLPSDLPLYDLAPNEMAQEFAYAAELELENDKNQERQQLKLIEEMIHAQDALTKSKQVIHEAPNEDDGQVEGGGGLENNEEVDKLKSENELLAQQLKEAEAMIKALQAQAGGPDTKNDENATKNDDVVVTEVPAVVKKESNTPGPAATPEGNSKGSNDAYANSKLVGARIRALQTQITLLNSNDPNSQSRFLHQPAGHRMEPMMDVGTYSHAGIKGSKGGTEGADQQTGEPLVLADGTVMDTKASADAIAAQRR